VCLYFGGIFRYCHTGTVAALVSSQYNEVGSRVSRGNESLVFKGIYHLHAAFMESSCEQAFLTFFLHLIAFLFVIQVQIYYYETRRITCIKPQLDQKPFSRSKN